MRFWEFFTPPQEAESEPDVMEAQIVRDFSQSPYYPRLMAWIDLELSRPFPITDQMAMIQSAVRANTFREIRTKIDRDIQTADAILKQSGRI